jgi:hypothetical protein
VSIEIQLECNSFFAIAQHSKKSTQQDEEMDVNYPWHLSKDFS